MTITMQIGNSDDKLTQAEWAEFVSDIGIMINVHDAIIHFFAASDGSKKWQNACWVFVLNDETLILKLKEAVKSIRELYKQDSVAWTEGDTSFV